MKSLSFKRHRFPADVIRHAEWLYFRFSLSFRDVEELLAAGGIDVSYQLWSVNLVALLKLLSRGTYGLPNFQTLGECRSPISQPSANAIGPERSGSWLGRKIEGCRFELEVEV